MALSGDRFLLWIHTGEMQIGTAAGQWGAPFRLAVRSIHEVKPDGAGFLASGWLGDDEHNSAVLLVDGEGKERVRWTLRGDIFGLLVNKEERSALLRGGDLVPLLGDGKLGTPERLPDRGPAPLGVPPKVLVRDAANLVVCREKNVSKQYNAPARCERTGSNPWRLEADLRAPLIACGEWLVGTRWSQSWSIPVHSLVTGEPKSIIHSDRRKPSLACPSPNELFVGSRNLQLHRLPGRKPTWTVKVRGGPITDLAVSDTAIAYTGEGSPDVMLIPRPIPPE